jgi:hypothetical protein
VWALFFDMRQPPIKLLPLSLPDHRDELLAQFIDAFQLVAGVTDLLKIPLVCLSKHLGRFCCKKGGSLVSSASSQEVAEEYPS